MDNINAILANAKSILVTSHLQPDPDAICSSLGMYDYILKSFPNAKTDIYLNGEKLQAYSTLKNYDDIKWIKDVSEVVNNYDTLVFTDGSHLSRFTNSEESIDLSRFKTICIDHHKNEQSNWDSVILESQEPSAAQIIYKYFFRGTNLIESNIAEVLLTGILSDTGMLRFVRPSALSTFDYVKELIEISDLDLKIIEDKYFNLTESDMDIISVLTTNITKVDDYKHPFIYSYLPMEYLNKYSLNLTKQGKSKFQMFFATSIGKYKWSFIATPNSDSVMNISLRSSPGVENVRLIGQQFGGGGHDLASGGEFPIGPGQDSAQVCLKIVEKIKGLNL